MDLLGQLLLCVSTQLEQSHEHGRYVHVRLPHRESSPNQIDGSAPDGAVGRQLEAGRLQQQEGQCFTCKEYNQRVLSENAIQQCYIAIYMC